VDRRSRRLAVVLYRDALARLAKAGFSPDALTWPAEAPTVEHTTHGFQYLTESRFDQVDPILATLRNAVQALGMPLISLEMELGRASTSSPSRRKPAWRSPIRWRCSAAR
jgi:hypothetical protein